MSTDLSLAPAATSLVDSLVFNRDRLACVVAFGDMMAKSHVTVPKHLQGKPSDCAAIVMQSTRWGMDPYAVAQKTHVTQGGALGYEAQLVNAVAINSGALRDVPEYEFLGDWDKILGKVAERQSQSGGKYYVADWKKEDEAGLGVIVRTRLRGEETPRELRVMMAQAYPRFSTQWATDPQQQISYLAVRKFMRRYAPDVLLGVQTTDEAPDTIDMGIAHEVVDTPPRGPQRQSRTAAPPAADPPTATVIDGAPAAAAAAAPSPKADDAKTVAETLTGLIDSGRVAYLRGKLKSTGTDEVSTAQRFGVVSLEGLTLAQFDELKAELLAAA